MLSYLASVLFLVLIVGFSVGAIVLNLLHHQHGRPAPHRLLLQEERVPGAALPDAPRRQVQAG